MAIIATTVIVFVFIQIIVDEKRQKKEVEDDRIVHREEEIKEMRSDELKL